MLEMLQTNFYKLKGSDQEIHIAIRSVFIAIQWWQSSVTSPDVKSLVNSLQHASRCSSESITLMLHKSVYITMTGQME